MNKQLLIDFKNGQGVSYTEENLDCSELTIMGHALSLVDTWTKRSGVYKIDQYNAVLLDDITDVKVQ